MPRVVAGGPSRQRGEIADVVTAHPQGLSREEISREYEVRYGTRLEWRTLLRRLRELVAAGDIRAVGEARRRVYAPISRGEAVALDRHAPAADGGEEVYVPVTPPGAEVRSLIRRPMSQREPVGYHLEFLEAYEPGSTWYLPESLRLRLRSLGRTPDPERPAGTFARDVLDRLLIDLSWASSRLEGNTYSRLDTQNLIEFGQQAEGKDGQQAQMILNHKRAIEFLVEEAEVVGFNRRTLTTLHSALSENLLDDPADEGGLRRRPVRISGTPFVPIAIPQVIEDALDMLLAKASAIPDPLEQAFFAMVHIPYLQPFTDVNKRTSRLAANIPLIRANLCPLSFVDVPEVAYVEGTLAVYELNRIELLRDVFVWAYARSCAQYTVVRESMGQPDPLRLRYRTSSRKWCAKPWSPSLRRRGPCCAHGPGSTTFPKTTRTGSWSGRSRSWWACTRAMRDGTASAPASSAPGRRSTGRHARNPWWWMAPDDPVIRPAGRTNLVIGLTRFGWE
jgi:fido (protein-threonine AMPylation protein)